MESYIVVEVLTGLLAGVPWSPWLFALQNFEVQGRSGLDRSGVRCWMTANWTADNSWRLSSQSGCLRPSLPIMGPRPLEWKANAREPVHDGCPRARSFRVRKVKRGSSSLIEAGREHVWPHPSVFWKHTCCIFSLPILTR